MSAITGIHHFNGEPASPEHGENMMKELHKFPADDIKTYYKNNIFLGCHAQWITPESVGEPLPFFDSERQIGITADAIIDNRTELFNQLDIDHAKRKTLPDSQLILLAYEKWGEECPKYLVGDFAFMIWDNREQKLFGARDASGYRPLYYYHNQYSFAFSTTIEPLLSLPYVEKKLNEMWLAEYLAITGTIDTVDARMTPFQDIMQVPPYHTITVHNQKITITRYGKLSPKNILRYKNSSDYVEAFQEVFQEAVNCRLRSNRNIGSQLSGGLDSGSVVSFAAKTLKKENKPLHTFSYIPPKDFEDFTNKRLFANESPYIKSTVNYVGGIKDHYLDFEGKNSYSEIDDMLDIMEMPYKFFENTFWLKGMFDGAAEENIGVLLNGDRGNWTISWGHALDYYAILLKRFKWIQLFRELDKYCYKVGGPRLRRLPFIARRSYPLINQLFPKDNSLGQHMFINQNFAERTKIFNKLRKYGIDQTGWLNSTSSRQERKSLFEDIFPWNTGNTLTAKLSLRHALWKRDPTNDLRVINYCLSVPEEQFTQNGMDRALIRNATKGYLPDDVRLNQRTRGIQGTDWIHRMLPEWQQYIDELEQFRNDKITNEYFDIEVLDRALTKAKHGPQIDLAYDPDYRTLMRGLIVYRFIKQFT